MSDRDGTADLDEKTSSLRRALASMGRVVVAFSGGADSAFLARVSLEELGASAARCLTAVSASLAAEELADCRRLAAEWNLDWSAVTTTELDDPRYVANGRDRCYRCKSALMDVLVPVAESSGATVVLGVNLDDLDDHRPGQVAARERGARFPLAESGFSKADVRAVSRSLGLRTWDKPAAACLASRLPYGTPVSVEVLGRVGRAESALRQLGFGQVRVRHYGTTARIEVPSGELERAASLAPAIAAAVRRVGYQYVTLDLEGFRSGNLNFADEAAHPGAGRHYAPGVIRS